MIDRRTINYSTVSFQLIEDLIKGLQTRCTESEILGLLDRSNLILGPQLFCSRVTLDQIVRLYQVAAIETGDEMMGLWSRPVRPGALKHLVTSVRESSSLPSAIFRFSTFWNLILDDYRFEVWSEGNLVSLNLIGINGSRPQPFGHMLILKLCHGLISWLGGREVPVVSVDFLFTRPEFAKDYAFIFPAPVSFDCSNSRIVFDVEKIGKAVIRTNADILEFMRKAPRDWIFTSYTEHTFVSRIRNYIFENSWAECNLSCVSRAFHMTQRTLLRRLEVERTSFQLIKDGMRRDMAIRYLGDGRKNIEEISDDLGFSSSSNFYRSFKRWTGESPSKYIRIHRKV